MKSPAKIAKYPEEHRLSEETDYLNPEIAERMLNPGFDNRFDSGVNPSSMRIEENKINPAEFLLGDYTTFKVVVQNADVIENDTDKTLGIILNTTECDTDDGLGTNSGTNIRVNGTNNDKVGTNSDTNVSADGTNNDKVGTNSGTNVSADGTNNDKVGTNEEVE
ncbi:MAG: hypothetical protein K2H74_08230, partial [Paramuribaculum sp.]|nr:hypothetical protein [Paramuribaculum sp.]